MVLEAESGEGLIYCRYYCQAPFEISLSVYIACFDNNHYTTNKTAIEFVHIRK